jgi:hypothetical protein
MTFNVTYQITTPESAELGDTDECGFVIENASLRDAIEAVRGTRTNEVSGIECVEPSEYPGDSFRWITVVNGMEYLTGAQECRAIHIPDNVTNASRARILRLVRGH